MAHLGNEHLVHVEGVRELLARGLPRHAVEEANRLGCRSVDAGNRVARHRERGSGDELGAQAWELELGDEAPLVAEDLHAREVVHCGEVLGCELDHRHRLLEVKDVGRVPVVGRVDVALGRCGHYEVPEAHGELDDAVPELKLVNRLVVRVHVEDGHLGRLCEMDLVVAPCKFPIHNLAKAHGAVAACRSELRAVAGPGDIKDGARVRRVARDGPASAIAEAEHIERAYREVSARGAPRHCSHCKVKGSRGVELSPKGVPDLVAAVLSA
mmetsp:Transcript_17090/g.46203  ORF Transcript_17090/g.46203 Transcript_17090/m.46203 type:complete len:269 (-) Transcript_17090:667-1473(-)